MTKKKLPKKEKELYFMLNEIRIKADKGLSETIAEAYLLGLNHGIDMERKFTQPKSK